MESNNKGTNGREGRIPQKNGFSPLNIGSIDYNTSNRDLDYDEEPEAIFEEADDIYDVEDIDDHDHSAFRTHRL